jgi:hypothetical protein
MKKFISILGVGVLDNSGFIKDFIALALSNLFLIDAVSEEEPSAGVFNWRRAGLARLQVAGRIQGGGGGVANDAVGARASIEGEVHSICE